MPSTIQDVLCSCAVWQRSNDSQNSVEMLRKQHAELFEHELWLIEADSDLDVLQHQSAEAQATLKNLEKELASLKEEIKRRKEEAIVKREAATKMIAETSPEEGAIQQQLSKEITLSELEGEISALSARLEVMSEGDPGVLKQYQDRAKRIEKLEKMLEKVDAETEDLTQKITGIREKWEPELDNLVAKISEAFSYHFTKIGCAGEVEVDKAEQFENWSIKIRVRFR